MVFQPAPHGVEVVLKMTQNGIPAVNVWNVDTGAAVTLSDLNALATLFDGWITSDYAPLIVASVNFDSLVVTDISVANGQQVIITPTTTTGGAGGTEQAANAAYVASLRTAFTGKSFRGRTYMPGLGTTMLVDAHNVSGAHAAAVNVAFVNLINLLITAGDTLVVLSRYAAGVLRVTALLTEIISVITDTKIDSQRRRTAN